MAETQTLFRAVLMAAAITATVVRADPSDDALAKAKRLADLYNWIDAAPLFAEAERLYAGSPDSDEARIAQCGQLRASMEERPLPILTEQLSQLIASSTSSQVRIFCLAARGDVHGELDSRLMKQDWELVRRLAKEVGDVKMENRAAGEVGYASFLEGDFVTARQLVAGALVKAAEIKDIGAQVRFLSGIGNGLALTGSAEQALGYLDKATRLVAVSNDFGYPFFLEAGRLQALRSLIRLDEAEALGILILGEAKARRKFVKQTQILISLASISVVRHRDQEAQDRLRQAIEIADQGGFSRLAATARFDLADVLRRFHRLDEAEGIATAALNATADNGETYLMPRRLKLLAQLQISQGKYEAAANSFSQAEDIVNGLIESNPNFSARTALIGEMGEIYTEHFALIANTSHDHEQVFGILESIRARAMRDLLAAGARARDEDASIDQRIAGLRIALAQSRSPAERKRLGDQIFLQDQLRWTASPDRGRYEAFSRSNVSLKQAQVMLAPDELLLGYVVADPKSFCLVISRSEAHIVDLPPRAEIQRKTELLLAAIQARRSHRLIAQQLHSTLIKPLPDTKRYRRLIILRDGPLYQLPFDALQGPDGRLVAQTHVVSYASSAGTLHILRNKPAVQPERTLLAIGGIPYDPSITKVAKTRGLTINGFGNIPASRDEAVLASRVLFRTGNKLLLANDATERAFKQEANTHSAVIHLAAHGLASKEFPDRAAILLVSDPAAGEDGILQATEIGQLNTDAQLIVLSACDTAVGRLQGQEGVANLSRAFLLSGARAVVSTLWTVDDTFTLTLMRAFYQNLAKQQSPAVALADAKRDLLFRFGGKLDPYFWAGFTLEGDGSNPLILTKE